MSVKGKINIIEILTMPNSSESQEIFLLYFFFASVKAEPPFDDDLLAKRSGNLFPLKKSIKEISQRYVELVLFTLTTYTA